MVVRGAFAPNAKDRLDLVVDEGTKDYVIVIAGNPFTDVHEPVYALRNKTTFVDEYYVPTLSRARYVIVELQKDLEEGVRRNRDPEEPAMPVAGDMPLSNWVPPKKAS